MATQTLTIDHFVKFPMCGHCEVAWDLIYDRTRSTHNILHYLNQCTVGGCDSDVWDYVDMATGWPIGVELGAYSGRPRCYVFKRGDEGGGKGHFVSPAPYDDRLFHRREAGIGEYDPYAPWRRLYPKFQAIAIERSDRLKEMTTAPTKKDKPTKYENLDWAETPDDIEESDWG